MSSNNPCFGLGAKTFGITTTKSIRQNTYRMHTIRPIFYKIIGITCNWMTIANPTIHTLTTLVYLVYQVNLLTSRKKIYLVYEVSDMSKKSEYITFRTDENTKRILEGMAKEEDRTLSYIINRILNEYLSKEGREE